MRPQLRRTMRTCGLSIGRAPKRGRPAQTPVSGVSQEPELGDAVAFQELVQDTDGLLGRDVAVADARPAGHLEVDQRLEVTRADAPDLDNSGVDLVLLDMRVDRLADFGGPGRPPAGAGADVDHRTRAVQQLGP